MYWDWPRPRPRPLVPSAPPRPRPRAAGDLKREDFRVCNCCGKPTSRGLPVALEFVLEFLWSLGRVLAAAGRNGRREDLLGLGRSAQDADPSGGTGRRGGAQRQVPLRPERGQPARTVGRQRRHDVGRDFVLPGSNGSNKLEL